MGEKAVLPSLQVELADLLYAKGDLEEAAELVERAKALSAADDSLTEMKWRSVLAKVLAASGRLDEATTLAAEAAAIGSATGYLDWYGGVLVDVAEVMTRAGRADEAAASRGRARELFHRKGNVVAARAVEERLSNAYH